MEITTLRVRVETKNELDKFKEHLNESYDEVIKKVIYIAKTSKSEPQLSRETMEQIEKARERLKKGKFVTEAEAKSRLGL